MKEDGGQEPPRRAYRMVERAQAAEATAERILAAAEQVFGGQPYDQASLREVADRSGVTVQTVMRRFGSKDALFVEMTRSRSAQIRAARDAAPVGDVAGLVRVLVDSYERVGTLQLHLLAQEGRTESITAAVRGGRRYHHAWVARMFAPWLDGLDAGARRRLAARLVAVTDLYTWKVLRTDVGLGRRATDDALRDLIEGALSR